MNPVRTTIALLLFGALFYHDILAGQGQSPLSLQQLEQGIDHFIAGQSQPADLPFDISGYSYHWRVDPGGGRIVVVMSCNLNGYLLLFSHDGLLVSTVATGEIASIQVCDLDQDGVGEVILDEVKGRGTGLLMREFHLYRLSRTGVEDLWHGTSFSRMFHDEGADKSYSSYERGSLRYSPGGSDGPRAHLVHRVSSDDGKGRRKVREVSLELRGGKVVVVASSP